VKPVPGPAIEVNMTKVSNNQMDDLEATRQVAAILQPFQEVERERIIRWAREKLGMAAPPEGVAARREGAPATAPEVTTGGAGATPSGGAPAATDIKTFIDAKNPKNGTQFAATVAYFHKFLARDGEKKETIDADDLIDAYRKAERERPKRPGQTLIDAYADGVLDKAERGEYTLNTVGENLVAMVLPGKESDSGQPTRGRRGGRKRTTTKKATKKKATQRKQATKTVTKKALNRQPKKRTKKATRSRT
jgi:hypothetical protein